MLRGFDSAYLGLICVLKSFHRCTFLVGRLSRPEWSAGLIRIPRSNGQAVTVRLQGTSVQHHHCVTVRSKNTAGQWDQRDLSNLGEACGRLALPWNWMSLGEWWTIKGRGQTKRDILICLLMGCMTEKAMATHSSTIAWKIPWMEEPGRLQPMGSRSRTRLRGFPFTFHSHALEKEMATHSSVLAWRIPGTGELGGLPSLGSHRVGHDWSDLAAAAAAAGYVRVWKI